MRTLKWIVAAVLLSVASFFAYAGDWAPAGDHIKTEWASKVNPDNPLPEYPRPQMMRSKWMSLNGLWNYSITGKEAPEPASADGKILVPFPVQSSLSGVAAEVSDAQALWYNRTFTLPKAYIGKNILLHFGAVDWAAEVYVNGTLAGKHTGGYTPFSFDITPLLKKSGLQTITLKVTDPTDNAVIPRGKQVSKPSGIWYTAVTGIWQTVWLEPVSPTRLESYYTTTDLKSSRLSVNFFTKGMLSGDKVRIQLLEGKEGYDPAAPSTVVLAEAESDASEGAVSLKCVNPTLWTPDTPYLYGLRIMVIRRGRVIDDVQGYTSFRKSSLVTDSKGFLALGLNDKPYFQYGPLDQGWWPDGLYTAPADEALRFDIEMTKAMGFNMIRKHVKVEPDRWYYHCDRLGIVVWQDMPSTIDNQANQWSFRDFEAGTDAKLSDADKANYFKEWSEIIAAKRVFNCIVVWVPFNEAWGQFETAKVVEFTRNLDDSRLINRASGGNHYEGVGDIHDCHNYPNPAMYLWSRCEANVVGEYGGIGLPLEGHLWQTNRNWGYIQYKNSKEVTDRYVRYGEELLDLVGRGCSGAVYTQTTDVEGEVNGLMTYDRKVVKLEIERVRESNLRVREALK